MAINPVSTAGPAATLLAAAEEAAVQERLNKAASRALNGAMAEVRGQLDKQYADRTTFSSSYWNPGETIDFSMDTYTKNGTRVQVDAGGRAFTFGNFANKGEGENAFKLTGARAPLDMTVTFTTEDGKSSTFTVNKSMTFHETADGRIVEGASTEKTRDKDDPTRMHDESNIVFNMDDKGAAVGGDGHDVLFNFAGSAYVNGMEGDDTLINMGNKATLKGGEGDDFMKVVKDVIRPEQESTVDLLSMRDEDTIPLWGVPDNRIDLDALTMVDPAAGQEVNMDAGEGNDIVDARDAKLENATVKGGDGHDTLLFDQLVASSVSGGAGDDVIEAEDVLSSSINAGAGDDVVNVARIKNSTIDAGAGDDAIRVDQAHDATIWGGDGDDYIDIGSAYESVIDGGDGNDFIAARVLDRSILNGGDGDDVIAVGEALSSVLDAGAGDDLISVDSFVAGTNSARMGAHRVPVILGGSGNDTIMVGEAKGGVIAGNEGDDVILLGRSQESLIAGGDGNDAIRTGTSADNLIDGGSGSNDIQLNLQVQPENMVQGRYEDQAFPDVAEAELKAFALALKQQTNNGVAPGSRDEGLTLTEEQWMQLAQDRLNKTTPHANGEGRGPDLVVDNGQLVQGTPDQLAAFAQRMADATGDVPDSVAEIAPYARNWRGGERSGTLLHGSQKTALKNYLESVQKLAQSEGAGTLVGTLAK